MKGHFAYIRVSTPKQGQRGVSLQEQRDAIARFAARNNLTILDWFEERETAAKRGRPVFGRMLKLLRQGKAKGILIHKIDRSARNLRDWADLGELIDGGIEVRFAVEDLDLHSRGGRLSADIQAVVAADFIRNLREETRKGFYGRIKQGFLPLAAPLGYLDCGGGKAKEIDPVMGPLVRAAFELYATGRYSLHALRAELTKRGLRNRRGNLITIAGLSCLLNNPFYIGLIRIQKTGEIFPGAHELLITKALFERVQRVLRGKVATRAQRHDFLFRRLLACGTCGYSLIGERQKGHVYYRCHTRTCPLTAIREDRVEEELETVLRPLEFSPEERAYATRKVSELRAIWSKERAAQAQTLRLTFDQIEKRLSRLTDAFLDGTIEKDLFESRKAEILFNRADVRQKLTELDRNPYAGLDRLEEFLELAGSVYSQYKFRSLEEKRELLRIVTSNRCVSEKNPHFRLSNAFEAVAKRHEAACSPPERDTPRSKGDMPQATSTLSQAWDSLIRSLLTVLAGGDAEPPVKLSPVHRAK